MYWRKRRHVLLFVDRWPCMTKNKTHGNAQSHGGDERYRRVSATRKTRKSTRDIEDARLRRFKGSYHLAQGSLELFCSFGFPENADRCTQSRCLVQNPNAEADPRHVIPL